MKPDLTLLGTPAKRMLVWLGFCSVLKAIALITFAYHLSFAVVGIIDRKPYIDHIWWAVSAAMLRALMQWFITAISARTAFGIKAQLQTKLLRKAMRLPKNSQHTTAEINTMATTALNTLDNYFTQFFPAMVATSTLPWILIGWIAFFDWISALIIFLTIGLIPAFMVLIGLHTQDSTTQARKQLVNMSHQLVELAQGLPVIIGLGKVKQQAKSFTAILKRYREKTMEVLRVSFMSSLALELIATISVALVAVVIGVRLVYDKMPLDIGLMVLILAPECYLPLREIGSGHHASEDGVDTLKAVKKILDEPEAGEIDLKPDREVLVFDDFQLAFKGSHALGKPLTVTVAENSIVALTGKSGTGKSTVLAVISGLLTAADVDIKGSISGVSRDEIAYVPQAPVFFGATVAKELELYAPNYHAKDLLALFNLENSENLHPIDLSPGEQRRLALARAVSPILLGDDKKKFVLLDEPTAHLDETNAKQVRSLIKDLKQQSTVLLVSHEGDTISLADEQIELAPFSAKQNTQVIETTEKSQLQPQAFSQELPTTKEKFSIRELIKDTGLNSKLYFSSILLGVFAAIASIGLTATSAWLIERASEHPPIMLLTVAIVGVRFFGISRAAARYFERLYMHDALFQAMEKLRTNMWENLAKLGLSQRNMLSSSRVVQIIVEQGDQLRDLVPRAINPVIVSWVAGVTTVLVMTLLQPSVFIWFFTLAILGLLLIPMLSAALETKTVEESIKIKSDRVYAVNSFLLAEDDLKANGKSDAVLAEVEKLNNAETLTLQKSSWREGFTTMLSISVAWATSALILLAANGWYQDGMSAGMVAVCALTPLAMTEIFVSANTAQVSLNNLKNLVSQIGYLLPTPKPETRTKPEGKISNIKIQDITGRWEGQVKPTFKGLGFELPKQDKNWLSVVGPSGSGKSTLLSILMGFLPYEKGSYQLIAAGEVYEAKDTDLTGKIAWCPQESHIFNSTLRGNLMLGVTDSTKPEDSRLEQVLQEVGFTRNLENGLETQLGASGSFLSGGERQKLAVARTLLSDANVVLLDEPTAHLDKEAAESLMADLRLALKDKLVVLITHHHEDILESDELLKL
ncbi:MAG: thiol reductant ABC exporter subunit CydC [Micrococcaceae bacterium]